MHQSNASLIARKSSKNIFKKEILKKSSQLTLSPTDRKSLKFNSSCCRKQFRATVAQKVGSRVMFH